MITGVKIKKFKRFKEVDIDLADNVVFIGPNNSGKSIALQALTLWEVGIRKWNEKRKTARGKERQKAVTLNRNDLTAIPTSSTKLLWNDLKVREVGQSEGRRSTKNIRIEITVRGVGKDGEWECGLEFDYANEESLYCRPLGALEETHDAAIPEEAVNVKFAFLPPMSGLASNEMVLPEGGLNVLIGEGRTAEVLRNMCYIIYRNNESLWRRLVEEIKSLFGIALGDPVFINERGEVTLDYREPSGVKLDLICAGRGAQHTILLLAHLYSNPESVLLLDEPDAHLEILRQRQIYKLLTETARSQSCQIIAASHSEVLLNEAAGNDTVIAFVGKPHRIDDRKSQVLKSLQLIGFDQYYQAEQKGWVLYLEGSTDLAILQQFARKLDHDAQNCLEQPFVHYIANQPSKAREHFYGIKEAKSDLVGIALFDRLEQGVLDKNEYLKEIMWSQREIENYLCFPETLINYAESLADSEYGPLFETNLKEDMENAIKRISESLQNLNRPPAFSKDIKASEEFLGPLFSNFFKKINLPYELNKSRYHHLVEFVPVDQIDPEVSFVLDQIKAVADSATSAEDTWR